MIKSLTIQNFQSHKETKLDFDEGVNAIIGTSDSGKTAIFRALRWVAENKPSGKDFHSWWSGDPRVSIVLDNGIEVVRERIKSENLYTMSEMEFKAFGQRVPTEIEQKLNFAPINFQWQMDSSFLLSQSPGEVSRYLNGIVNLESIDVALSNIERRLREEVRDVQSSKSNIEKYKEQIQSYDWLPGVEKELEGLEKLDNDIVQLMGKIVRLNENLEWLDRSERELEEVELVLKWKKDVEGLLVLQEEVDELQQDLFDFEELLEQGRELEFEIERVGALLKLEGELNKLLELQVDIETLESDIAVMTDALTVLDSLQDEIFQMENLLDQLRRAYEDEMPDVCPLCGQPIVKLRRRKS